MTIEQQDAQRIALVATLATQLLAAERTIYGTRGAWLEPSGAMFDAIKDATVLVNLAEQAVRTPTGDA